MDKELLKKQVQQKGESALEFPQEKLEKIDQAYSSEPWWYDVRGFLILTFAYRTTLPAQIRLFANHMGTNHLEAAIGTGTLFEIILKWRKWKNLPSVNVVGFDYAERMLAGAKKRFRKEKNFLLIRADAADLPLEDNSFDTASIANAIHCLPDVAASFDELHRVLKPEGLLIGNCLLEPKGSGFLDKISRKINTWGVKKGILYKTYYANEVIELLLSSGFILNKKEVAGNCLNFIARKKESSVT